MKKAIWRDSYTENYEDGSSVAITVTEDPVYTRAGSYTKAGEKTNAIKTPDLLDLCIVFTYNYQRIWKRREPKAFFDSSGSRKGFLAVWQYTGSLFGDIDGKERQEEKWQRRLSITTRLWSRSGARTGRRIR